MGAFGAAIIAQENYVEDTESSLITLEEMDKFTVENSHARCGGCENNCLLTINKFNDGSKFITGNRCEKGEGKQKGQSDLPDLYDYKLKRLFRYKPLSEDESTRGTIGIPRVLNMRNLILAVDRERQALGMDDYSVVTEATHWSGAYDEDSDPSLLTRYPVPMMDIEVGSDPSSWDNMDAWFKYSKI